MSRKLSGTSDPTRDAWITAARPTAERAIRAAWQDGHRFAILDAGPGRRDPKGRPVRRASLDTARSRVEAYHGLRYQLSVGLSDGTLSIEDARAAVAGSEFAGELHIAATPAEAMEQFAALLVNGNNAWTESEFRRTVLWIKLWRE